MIKLEAPARALYAFELQLDAQRDGYRAKVTLSPGGGSPEEMLPFKAMTGINAGTVAIHRKDRFDVPPGKDRVREIGSRLFDSVFAPGIATEFDKGLRYASGLDGALRVRLKIAANELAALPWEVLFAPERLGYVAISNQTTLARFLHPKGRHNRFATSQRKVKSRLGVLLHICGIPTGWGKISSAEERHLIKRALQPLFKTSVNLYQTSGRDWAALRRAIDDTSGAFDILHIIGHGDTFEEGKAAVLMGDGEENRVYGDELAKALEHSGIRLVVLNTCKSGMMEPNNAFAGVAQNIVLTAIPAALAMQFSISNDAAVDFSGALYSAIAKGVPLDVAVTNARIGMLDENNFEWMTPVLYIAYPDAIVVTISPPMPRSKLIPLVPRSLERRRRKLLEASRRTTVVR